MKKQRTRAVSILKWIVLTLLTIIAFACFKLGIIPSTVENKVMMFVCCMTVIPSMVYHLMFATYISENGVEYCRLGQVIRKLSWEDMEQICVIRNFRLSARASGLTRIVVIPVGCEKYSSKKWSGIHYLLAFRNRVIWIDNTKHNRQIIEANYGRISDLRNN